MKKLIIIICCILLVFMCGCGRKPGDDFVKSGRFTIVSGGDPNAPYYDTIIVDNNTGVMYLALYNYSQFGITPLLDTDGTLMLITDETGG